MSLYMYITLMWTGTALRRGNQYLVYRHAAAAAGGSTSARVARSPRQPLTAGAPAASSEDQHPTLL